MTTTTTTESATTAKPRKLSAKAHAAQDAINQLREVIHVGDELYTIVKNVSRSGMYRHIAVLVKTDDGIRNISRLVARAIGEKSHDDGSVGVGGCGMDMCFEIVYTLGRVLFRDGFGDKCRKCGQRPLVDTSLIPVTQYCPMNPNLPHEFYGRNGDPSGWDNDGGYALKYRTL